MYELREHAPHLLSGGQKQRVAIAGVIAMQPRCIVLDEPTAMLDPMGRRETVDTIRTLNRKYGVTVVLITHHMDEAAQADRLMVMSRGQIIDDGPPGRSFSMWRSCGRQALRCRRRWPCSMNCKGRLSVPLDAISDEACAAVLAGLLK